MKVLTMYQKNIKGGVLNWLKMLVELMLRQKWGVHYLSTEELPIKNKKLIFHKINLLEIKMPFFVKFFPNALRKANELNKNEKFDLIVVPGALYAYIASYLKNEKTRIVTFVHGDLLKEQLITKGRIAAKITEHLMMKGLKASDKIVVVNNVLKEQLISKGIRAERIKVLYNRIDKEKFKKGKKTKEFENYKRRGKLIAYIGTLDKIKNVSLLIEAFALINKKAMLFIIGDGPELENLKALTKKLKLKNVVFTGFRKDVPSIMRSLDLIVLPSINEACPLVLLEALNAEVPCIGSNVGGVPEILHYKELLFKVNDKRELAKRILSAFDKNNYLLMKKLCLKRKKAFDFNWNKEVLKILSD